MLVVLMYPSLDAHAQPRLLTGTEAVAKAALSNLLGGIGYFYGRSQVALPGGRMAWSAPAGLLTAVPSRPFFPRGFMWDEGFHQVILIHSLCPDGPANGVSSRPIPCAALCGTRAFTRCPAWVARPGTLATLCALSPPPLKQGHDLANSQVRSCSSRVLLRSAQLLVRRWNGRLSRDILGSWLDLLNSQGWIAREQATFLLFIPP